jgi:hypothetical protein
MKSAYLVPIALLAFAAACSDTATSPTSVDRPLFSVGAGFVPGTLDAANTPSGGHLQSGTIGCTVAPTTFSITCSSYRINGIGHTNATLLLTANYTATIDCTNNGGNLVESHTVAGFNVSSGPVTLTASKNGSLSVPGASVSASSAPQVCPNPNWTPSIRSGTIVLNSFSYTLTFAGFSSAAVTIAS